MKKKILCFLTVYIPGFKFGGPIRTIKNFVDNFGDEFEIKIICQDCDYLDIKPYKNVKSDNWTKVGKASVFYASKKTLNFNGIASLLKNTSHELLYLNSFFNFKFTILPLFLRYLKMVPKKPCIIAPRGEFSNEALKLKINKKKSFIFFSKLINLYQNLFWQASSKFEKDNIINNFGIKSNKICIAPNLTQPVVKNIEYVKNEKKTLRLLFLSRISPMKNLDFLLRALSFVDIPIKLDIKGIKENLNYSNQCELIKNKLPKNIEINFGDKVKQDEVKKLFKNYDLYVLPTRGENFGHIIFEAISNGLPAMISDKTLWKPDSDGGLEVVPLVENKWANAITRFAKLNYSTLYKKRQAALNYAQKYNSNNNAFEKNKKMINLAIKNNYD
tara:strand:- start:6464 stop:7624 length:1161 start_codon:yes stop_codon:yes gene_type:complete